VTQGPSAADIDRLSDAEFRALVAPLFEAAPGFLRRLVAARPFGSDEAMFEEAREIAHAMPEIDQLELVDAHPRLGAPPGSVSAMSYVEQGYDRDRADAHAEAERERIDRDLAELNDAYEARFGFHYCVFVAGRPRPELLPAFRAALDADREAELPRAIDAVIDIARDRYLKLSRAQEAR
jgi:2-oxo-4-hydroxy-4-carboxy--5-ureidoimidazoline (OHCU) decarboxylase